MSSADGKFRADEPHGDWRTHRVIDAIQQFTADTDYMTALSVAAGTVPSDTTTLHRGSGGNAGGLQFALVLVGTNGKPVARGSCTYTATILYLATDDDGVEHVIDTNSVSSIPANKAVVDTEAGAGKVAIRVSSLASVPTGAAKAKILVREVG